jgi:hypothetical protein
MGKLNQAFYIQLELLGNNSYQHLDLHQNRSNEARYGIFLTERLYAIKNITFSPTLLGSIISFHENMA